MTYATSIKTEDGHDIVIFGIEDNGRVLVTECCDLEYSVSLTKESFGKVIEQLKQIHNNMTDQAESKNESN